MAALVKAIAALVLLVSVTDCAGLVVPTFTFPKLKLVGVQVRVGISVSFAINASAVAVRVVWKAPVVIGKVPPGCGAEEVVPVT
jgi:hypothetical protein